MPTRSALFQVPGAHAGPYRWDFQDKTDVEGDLWHPLGIVESAPEIELQTTHEEVIGDNLGQTIQDIINTGANCFVSLVIQEFSPYDDSGTAFSRAYEALFPWWVRTAGQDPIPHNNGSLMDVIGQGGLQTVGGFARATYDGTRYDSGCHALLATSLHNYNSRKPFQILFRRATIAPNSPLVVPMGTRLRNMPVRLQMMPHPAGGNSSYPLRFYETSLDSPGFTIAGPV